MKLIVMCVWDEKVGAFAHPFFVSAIGQGSRMFGDWVQDPNTAVSRHPEDYRLLQLGTFDDRTGELESLERPALVALATDFVLAAGVRVGAPPLKEAQRG